MTLIDFNTVNRAQLVIRDLLPLHNFCPVMLSRVKPDGGLPLPRSAELRINNASSGFDGDIFAGSDDPPFLLQSNETA